VPTHVDESIVDDGGEIVPGGWKRSREHDPEFLQSF